MAKTELYHDNFQNYKQYNIRKAQLVIADIPYNLGVNAYASNPEWYVGGDNKNGESKKAAKSFFNGDGTFNIAEYFHFCNKLLIKEPKEKGKAPAMIVFCAFEQIPTIIEYGKKHGFKHYYPLIFCKNYSAQVLKANMKIVGATEYAIVLYRDKLPKFNNIDEEGNKHMVFNWFEWRRDNTKAYAIKTVLHNFPEVQELGDVFDEDFSKYENVDFLIGGSPCTYWSIAQSPDKRETTASGLGWELFSQYVRAIKEAKPKYFIYENNKSMAKAIYESISETFGFEPIMINSALVSAQNRQRLYWVGKRNADGTYSKVDVKQPEDKGILLRDVLDGITDREKGRAVIGSTGRTTEREYFKKFQGNMSFEPVGTTKNEKAFALTSYFGDLTNRRVGTKDKAYCLAANPSSDMSARVIEPVIEPKACRCRGRKDENENGYAKYECRNDCKSNTLDTNSTNGNMIAEPVDKPIRVGVYPTSDGCMLNSQGMRIYSIDGKSVTQSAQGGGMGAKTGLYAIPVELYNDIPIKATSLSDGKTYKVYEVKNGQITIKEKQYPIKLIDGYYIIRKLTISECKRLQTVPEWYEFPISNTQAYKCLGNGWTIDVIAHLINATRK